MHRAFQILCSLALITPGVVRAQVLTTVEFSFSNPGARSMGFGGAFVALADDATAAFANPAGLVQLARPEVSAEMRHWRYSTPYTRGGRASGVPTGLGIDTVSHPLPGESNVDLTGLSFLSFVLPKGNWSFAGSQHQLMNFEMNQEIQGVFTPEPVGGAVSDRGPVSGSFRGPIELAFFDFEISSRSLSVSYRANDRLSLGLGLSHFDTDVSFGGRDFLPDEDTDESYFEAASFLPPRLLHTVRADSRGSDWGLAAGFLSPLTARWTLGAVYREGPEVELHGGLTAGPVEPDLPAGTRVDLGSGTWGFPDVYGLGLSYRSRDGHWTAAFEWDRVEYSTIEETLATAGLSEANILLDGDEFHLGGEYAFFVSAAVWAVRLGAWHDPDHRVRSKSSEAFGRAELQPGEDELHFAAGLGVVLDEFQIDLGFDLSQARDTASLSAIYSF
ncbi:MAG: hypothetical protein OES47_12155 [Acidobacteriota bacterium]|nr:hypothetical protein [Acidobacteriota bacterium]